MKKTAGSASSKGLHRNRLDTELGSTASINLKNPMADASIFCHVCRCVIVHFGIHQFVHGSSLAECRVEGLTELAVSSGSGIAMVRATMIGVHKNFPSRDSGHDTSSSILVQAIAHLCRNLTRPYHLRTPVENLSCRLNGSWGGLFRRAFWLDGVLGALLVFYPS